MRFFTIKDRRSGVEIYVSGLHFGVDVGYKNKIRFHGISSSPCQMYLSDMEAKRLALEDLKREEERHKYCIIFPWIARFRKDLYERV